jgi:hypothetical protein
VANPTVAALVTDIVTELGGVAPTDLDATRSRPSHWPGKVVYRKADYQPGDTSPSWEPWVVLTEDLKFAINDGGVTKYVDRTLTTPAISTGAGDATTPYFCVIQKCDNRSRTEIIHQFDITDLTGVKALVGTIATPWVNPSVGDVLPHVGAIGSWSPS